MTANRVAIANVSPGKVSLFEFNENQRILKEAQTSRQKEIEEFRKLRASWHDLEMLIDEFFYSARKKDDDFCDNATVYAGRNNYNKAFIKLFNSRHGKFMMKDYFDWNINEMIDGDLEDSVELYIISHEGDQIGYLKILNV